MQDSDATTGMPKAWMKRAYQPGRLGDEDILVSLWCRRYATTPAGRRHRERDREGYWRQHADIAVALVDRCTTQVIVDAQAMHLVWAFACWSPGVVHFAAVHPKFSEWRTPIMSDLLGEQFAVPLRHSYLIPDLTPTPSAWILDPHCLHDVLSQPTARRASFLQEIRIGMEKDE